MTRKTPIYPKLLTLLFVCAIQPVFGGAGAGQASGSQAVSVAQASPAAQSAAQAVAEAAAAVQVVEPGVPAAKAQPANVQAAQTTAAKAQPDIAATAVFPKINPRWRKWELSVIADHARKNNWQPLPTDSVRIVPYDNRSNKLLTAFQVNLSSGEVSVLGGAEDLPKIRSFKLQAPELEDLRRLLEGKPFADLSPETQGTGKDGQSLLIETDWKGEYRWRLYWGQVSYPMPEIRDLVMKAYQREQR